MKQEVADLLYQGLETELGGVEIYSTALTCVVNPELKKEWQEYLEQTRRHVEIMEETLQALGLDVKRKTPGREVVAHIGKSLVEAMKKAKAAGNSAAAEIVAAECVVLAETKDHLNWELLGEVAKQLKGDEAKALRKAHKEVEEQEDEHLYHTTGWTRELWLQTLGMPAVLPPPEEEKDVKTAIGAARAKAARKELLPKH
jgi:ferritin-like metal-binding protein YciE